MLQAPSVPDKTNNIDKVSTVAEHRAEWRQVAQKGEGKKGLNVQYEVVIPNAAWLQRLNMMK